MYRPKHLLILSILLLLCGISTTTQAQLSDAEYEKRFTAAMALLTHGSEDEQGAALSQLTQLKLPAEKGIPIFRAHLERHTKSVAERMALSHAIEGLAQYGPQAQAALPDLIQVLDEVGTVEGEATYGGQTYWWLTTALSKIGPNDMAAVEALKRAVRRCMESPDRLDQLLWECVTALGNMGPAAHSAAPLLTTALQRCPKATRQIAWSLSHMMPEATLSIPTLIRTLEAGREPEAVIDALDTIGPAAKSALPALQRSLALPSPTATCKAFAAIAHIQGAPAMDVPGAVKILQQMDLHRLPVVYAAFETVRQQKLQAKEAIPTLLTVAHRPEPWLRRTTVETLAAVGPQDNREAALLLLKAARGDDPVLALEPDKAFAEFGKSATQVPAELGALFLVDNPHGAKDHLIQNAYRLLATIGDRATPALPSLVQALQPQGEKRWPKGNVNEIFWLLNMMGPQAQEAVPVLTDMVLRSEEDRSTSHVNRVTVMTTLMKIGITPRALPAIREMLASDQPTEVACAAHAVALLGDKASDTLPLLLRPLRPEFKDSFMTSGFFYGYSYDTSARVEAMRTLAHFGPAAKEALPLLQPYAGNETKRIYREVVLSEEAQKAIQAIRQTRPQE